VESRSAKPCVTTICVRVDVKTPTIVELDGAHRPVLNQERGDDSEGLPRLPRALDEVTVVLVLGVNGREGLYAFAGDDLRAVGAELGSPTPMAGTVIARRSDDGRCVKSWQCPLARSPRGEGARKMASHPMGVRPPRSLTKRVGGNAQGTLRGLVSACLSGPGGCSGPPTTIITASPAPAIHRPPRCFRQRMPLARPLGTLRQRFRETG